MAAPALVPHPKPALLRLAASRERSEQAALKRAIDRSAKVLDRLEERSKSFDLEMKRLKARKEAACGKFERYETTIVERMQQAGLEKLVGNDHTLALRANAPSLQVVDRKLIPTEYIRSKVIEEADKVAIKVALARGAEIQGVSLVQTVSLIRK